MEPLTDLETLQLETETRTVAAIARWQNWQAGIDGLLFQVASTHARVARLERATRTATRDAEIEVAS